MAPSGKRCTQPSNSPCGATKQRWLAIVAVASSLATFAPTQADPHPAITIASPDNNFATNATTLAVRVTFRAAANAARGLGGNVQDVDLLMNGAIVQTIPHSPPVREGAETFVVDISGLPDQTVTFVARAFQGNRHAGHAGESQAVQVIVDRTPPRFALSWPPNSTFGTDLDSVSFEGTATDNLAGMASITIATDRKVAPLPANFHQTEFIDTTTTPETPYHENSFVLTATDRAGNTTRQPYNIVYTLGTTIIPLDTASLVDYNGQRVSQSTAFVVFAENTTRQAMRLVIERHGARIAGFIETLDTVLVEYPDNTDFTLLLSQLRELRKEPLVQGIQLDYVLAMAGTLDNERPVGLGEPRPIAYDNATASAASHWIESNVPPERLRPVTVAVLDSGLDPSLSVGEFDGMHFVDAEGVLFNRSPVLPFSDPFDVDLNGHHGTKVASVVAGRNNGQGNNGVATFLGGPSTGIIAYRIQSTAEIDYHAVAIAANDIIRRRIEIANCSFGSCGCPGTSEFESALMRQVFAKASGTLWVCAAGNSGPCSRTIPASLASEFPNVISVAAHAPESDTYSFSPSECAIGGNGFVLVDGLLPFSNFDASQSAVQVSAPGARVKTALGYFAGTSAAAPMVAGAAALLKGVTGMPARDAKDILIRTGRAPTPRNPHPALDCLASLVFSSAMMFSHEEFGVAFGSQTVLVPSGIWTTPPGLTGFNFQFLINDYNLERIHASADIALVGTRSGSVSARFSDENNHEFAWNIKAVSLPVGTTYGSVQGASANGGAVSDALNGSGVLVIRGLDLHFLDGEHAIHQISIEPDASNSHIILGFGDDFFDDPFEYRVDYAFVPLANVIRQGDTGLQFGNGAQSTSIQHDGRGVPVIRGFLFEFTPLLQDHDLQRLQVDIGAFGDIRVAFHDDTFDDPYFWRVDWAIVVP